MDVAASRFVFNRFNRIPQFIRAILIVAAGIAVFVTATRLSDNLTPALRCIGGGLAVSGVIAVLTLMVLTRRDVTQVVEVDAEGLTLRREGAKPLTRTVKWAEVASYEVEEGRSPILGVDEATAPTNTASMGSGDNDLFGCLFGIALAIYLSLLQWFIGGGAWTVRFRLAGKRNRVSFSGYGGSMHELVTRVLPQHLPDKLVKPKAAETPQSSSEK